MDEDFLLIQKMKLGNEAAVDAFVHKYYTDILHYCYRHLYDNGEAEDITQETFERFSGICAIIGIMAKQKTICMSLQGIYAKTDMVQYLPYHWTNPYHLSVILWKRLRYR